MVLRMPRYRFLMLNALELKIPVPAVDQEVCTRSRLLKYTSLAVKNVRAAAGLSCIMAHRDTPRGSIFFDNICQFRKLLIGFHQTLDQRIWNPEPVCK